MQKFLLTGAVILSAGCLALCLSHCASVEKRPVLDGAAVAGIPPGVVVLPQNWGPEQRQVFWFTSQGSRLLPYQWYLALEQAASSELFRSDAHMNELRYLVQRPSDANQDGLPIGFTMDTDRETGKAWVGFTCSACHSNQIDYKGTAMRIDGAPTLADTFRFCDELVAALQATSTDDAKFERFARKVLQQDYGAQSAQQLRDELRATADVLATRQAVNKPEHPYGFARLDAFGAIFNQVLGANLGLPENYRPANAPVSYPFIWDAPHSDLVQWNGSAPNAGPGPLARNVGEILGVYATLSIAPERGLKGYPSSARVIALGELEKILTDLWSPLWPAEILPAIDESKAAQGQAIFQQQCANCHATIDRTSPERRITAVMNPVAELGTDPTMANNAAERVAKTGRLQGERVAILKGETLGTDAKGIDILENAVVGTILAQKGEALRVGLDDYDLRIKKARSFAPRSYKARSLNGIWATAPYLHNGSVPSLWQLLQPEGQRVKVFYVGSRELDPVHVGFDTRPYPGGFKFDVGLPGNSNAGHLYGTTLTDDQKWALVEYLKSL